MTGGDCNQFEKVTAHLAGIIPAMVSERDTWSPVVSSPTEYCVCTFSVTPGGESPLRDTGNAYTLSSTFAMDQNPAAAVNLREGLRLPETSSRCVTEGRTHDLEITNYRLLEAMGVGKYITSSTFTVGGYDWNIRFYPDGNTEDCAGKASAFLCYLSRTKDVRAKFTLTVLENKSNVHVTKILRRFFSPESASGGFLKFAEKSELKFLSNLNGGRLTVRCDLAVIKQPPVEFKKNLPPPELPGHLERTLKNGRGTDITLHVGYRTFSEHRFMLAARSPVFGAQLFGPMMDKETRRIEVVDMEPAIFDMLLHFIYTDSLPLCHDKYYDVATMQHLLVAADRYGLDRLKVMCEENLCKSIDVKTVQSTLALANQHYCERLKDACAEFMSRPGATNVLLLTEWFKRLKGFGE